MEYFCYISRTKVDQLYHGLAPELPEEWTEQRATEHDLGVNLSSDWNIAKILTLFKGGITYGRKGVIQREQKIKLHYVQKLRRVLLELVREGPIPSLTKSLEVGSLQSLYYHHEGRFTVTSPIVNVTSDTVLTIRTELPSKQLLLDCSLRFFSEGNQPDGMFHVHSTNIRFFSKKMGLRLETVFLLLNQNENDLVGTPLFLNLCASPSEFVSL